MKKKLLYFIPAHNGENFNVKRVFCKRKIIPNLINNQLIQSNQLMNFIRPGCEQTSILLHNEYENTEKLFSSPRKFIYEQMK